MRIINGKIFTMTGRVIEDGYIEFNNNIITSIGEMHNTDAGTGDFDVEGSYIFPGFIDAHTCIGLKEESNRYEGVDWNEESFPLTPELDAFDGFNPQDFALKHALRGGVTTAIVSPGNTNLIGGQTVAMKLAGDNPFKMVLKRPCSIKFSLGEEPKKAYGSRNHAPCTRMAELAMLRDILHRTEQYMNGAKAEYDAKTEALLPLLLKKVPAYIHANRADDIVSALELSKEFGFRCVIVHGAESFAAAKEIRAAGSAVIAGSLVLTNYSFETRFADLDVAARLWKQDVPFCITSDHHMSPIEYLPVSAALTMRAGLPMEKALSAITYDAARIAEIDDRVGSLEVGKDADIVIFNKHPFEYDAQLTALFVNGNRVC